MIDYALLSSAANHYEAYGFARIEVPWFVSKATADITKPQGAQDFTIQYNDKSLVASGEQGFLYQMTKGQLTPGRYQTITPCFRVEAQDIWHAKSFMKLELIDTKSVTDASLSQFVEQAYTFFNLSLTRYKEKLKIVDVTVPNGKQYDIVYDEIELGSYGIRKHEYLHWVYGTGLAEPRFSNLLKSLKIK